MCNVERKVWLEFDFRDSWRPSQFFNECMSRQEAEYIVATRPGYRIAETPPPVAKLRPFGAKPQLEGILKDPSPAGVAAFVADLEALTAKPQRLFATPSQQFHLRPSNPRVGWWLE